jgi:hypothetical protein
MQQRSGQFVTLQKVHETHGRVRWRYQASTGLAASAITPALRELAGTRSVRVNSSIQALIVTFDPALTSAAQLEPQILALQFACARPERPAALPSGSSLGPSLAVLLGRPLR